MKNLASEYLCRLQAVLASLDTHAIDAGVAEIYEAWQRGSQIITCGNGGSALTALHFVTDWAKMVYLKHGTPFRGRTLLDNVGLITAYSNDQSYEDLFCEQLRNIMQEGDLVIAISGSGNSENVIRAIEYANKNGGRTIGLCGFSGGRLKELAQLPIWVEAQDMQLVEDVHAIFGHIVMQSLCDVKHSPL
ncbi:D-sedoheptulose-7-phosphate isomerase [Brucella sp. 2716]|uniref:D-sedoheptulose-7-phosphate isomerase n=1 Tax=Brucella sp. 2716 TaxID=2975052 RepID=UPI00217D0E7F|nr:SIS domain-containing protein [Brucella sp. 2716]UWF59410.1 SIS domain-containing protein [Brucella sp. 2716]